MKETQISYNRENEQNALYISIGKILVDVWKGFKRFWWLILILIIAWTTLVLFHESTAEPMYQAQASFTVKTMESGSTNEADTSYSFSYDRRTAAQMTQTFPYILNSDILMEQLKDALGTADVNGSISASSIENSNLFTLAVTSNSKEDALHVLEAVIQVYPEVSQYVIGKTKFEMVEAPEVSETPINTPDYIGNIVECTGKGLMIGIVFLFLYALIRKTIRTEEDLKKVLHTSCLALLPEFKEGRKNASSANRTILDKEMDTDYVENIYSLQTRVAQIMTKNEQKVLMVTSTVPAEGKTTISMNLAMAMAQSGKKVLLIDGDLRKPSIQKSLCIEEKDISFNDVLEGKADVDDALHCLSKMQLYFLGNSKAARDSLSLIHTATMKNLIASFRETMDFIVIDVPPCGVLADAEFYWSYVDAVLYVVRQDWIKDSDLTNAVQSLPENGAKLIGCTMNRVQRGFSGYRYGYGYGYGYGRYGYGAGKYNNTKKYGT